jgi:hypothetical protein
MVTVRNAKQCVETFGPITITEPDPLTADSLQPIQA